ncbi:helix-turn-helix domain-containing protein [Rothia terrae]|uniref:Winged helix-turn-helix domain-containing protein n=1 Tax=Rothia terrae TaxID=396015 RepID=A0A7S7B048_9MICC|nr:helix-turn-helix domain-containing protein [Rothia terrae]QOW64764.1 winged helix-turn-helix domain-containing protein [Rothia terrae]
MAKATAIPAGYTCTALADHWLQTVEQNVDLSCRRADFTQNFLNICKTLARSLDRSTGIVRITWETLSKLTGTSRATIARVLRTLKAHHLLGVIASGRSAKKTPRGQQQQNLAPVYALLTPTPPTPDKGGEDDYFYDENGNLFITDTPSPLRDEKISYNKAKATGAFSIFFKQQYALYAATHRKNLELKRQHLQGVYPTKKAHQQALTHLARVLQHHCYDLRAMSARAIIEATQPFFEAGWSVRDVLYALEYSPTNHPYNTKGATGMRSVKKWLHLRLNAWLSQGEILPSRTAVEEQQHREQKAQHVIASQSRKKVCGPSVEVKRQIKVALLGEKKARYLFPELF